MLAFLGEFDKRQVDSVHGGPTVYAEDPEAQHLEVLAVLVILE